MEEGVPGGVEYKNEPGRKRSADWLYKKEFAGKRGNQGDDAEIQMRRGRRKRSPTIVKIRGRQKVGDGQEIK